MGPKRAGESGLAPVGANGSTRAAVWRVPRGIWVGISLGIQGLCITVQPKVPTLIYTQPSGLTSDWALKYSATLQSGPRDINTSVALFLVPSSMPTPSYTLRLVFC